jgi:hypothetical protein
MLWLKVVARTLVDDRLELGVTACLAAQSEVQTVLHCGTFEQNSDDFRLADNSGVGLL